MNTGEHNGVEGGNGWEEQSGCQAGVFQPLQPVRKNASCYENIISVGREEVWRQHVSSINTRIAYKTRLPGPYWLETGQAQMTSRPAWSGGAALREKMSMELVVVVTASKVRVGSVSGGMTRTRRPSQRQERERVLCGRGLGRPFRYSTCPGSGAQKGHDEALSEGRSGLQRASEEPNYLTVATGQGNADSAEFSAARHPKLRPPAALQY